MYYDPGGINHRTKTRYFQSLQLRNYGLNYLVEGSARFTFGYRTTFAFQALSDNFDYEFVRIFLTDLFDTLIGKNLIHAG